MRITARALEQMIRYEDDALLVVHKPPFLAVETKNIRQQDLLSLLTNRCAAKGARGSIFLVHRLDQPVEGLIVLAKTKQAAAAFGRQLNGGGFIKEYLAVVYGVTKETETLIHTLRRDGRTNTSAAVTEGTPDGKEARLSYERLAVADKKSLLRIRLDTGRHHQIRVQLAAIGHPLFGDLKYGTTPVTADENAAVDAGGQPLALCSSRLCFAHPTTGASMELVTAPTGAGFTAFRDVILF